MMSSICRIYKTKLMKQAKHNRNRIIDTENKQVLARGEGLGGGKKVGEGD